jgi:hypothetical protein
LRRKPYYREYLEELDAAEAQAVAVGGDDEAESTLDLDTEFGNLENRVTNLKARFARIKKIRARKGKDGKPACSGSNPFGPLPIWA